MYMPSLNHKYITYMTGDILVIWRHFLRDISHIFYAKRVLLHVLDFNHLIYFLSNYKVIMHNSYVCISINNYDIMYVVLSNVTCMCVN